MYTVKSNSKVFIKISGQKRWSKGGRFSDSPVFMSLFTPNYQSLYEPIREFPVIESFLKTLDLKFHVNKVPKMLWDRNISGSFEKRTPGRKLNYLKRLGKEPINLLKMFPIFSPLTAVKNPPSLGDFKLQIDRLKRPVPTNAKHSWYRFKPFSPPSFQNILESLRDHSSESLLSHVYLPGVMKTSLQSKACF